jgi:conjugative relaxase-like TrwC/TraI family protein
VVADIAKLSVGPEEYYTRELATDHEQYLSGHGESPGRWYGAGASSLGLQGEASPAGFQAMFEGRHPDTGELLGRPHGRNAVPGFDVVLRPTKSVSILYGLGDPATGRAVLAAHHAGLAEAVRYLDKYLGTRRGHGGVQYVDGQGLLAVGFDHRTSREGDPLLHTHLVIANRIQGPDGRWTALDGRDLYRHRLAADAIYRATYQRELSRSLGVEWTAADRHGNRELQGMSEALVRGFSKRTDQIRIGPSAPSPITRPSGPTGSGPARPSIGFVSSSAPPTVATNVSRPASGLITHDRMGGVAGEARSGPPADTSTKEASMARPSPRRFPFDDDDRPSGSVRPLSQADLQAILAHLSDDPDQLLAGTDADQPVVTVRVRATVGRPGGSAQARWRRARAAEWAAWTRTLPWRAAATLAVGAVGGLLGSLLAPRLSLVVGGLAAAATAWGLRFRPSPDAVAWRRGAAGERRTARLLVPLERQGWMVLHDLAVASPGCR